MCAMPNALGVIAGSQLAQVLCKKQHHMLHCTVDLSRGHGCVAINTIYHCNQNFQQLHHVMPRQSSSFEIHHLVSLSVQSFHAGF